MIETLRRRALVNASVACLSAACNEFGLQGAILTRLFGGGFQLKAVLARLLRRCYHRSDCRDPGIPTYALEVI